jgi:hypothetical protein
MDPATRQGRLRRDPDPRAYLAYAAERVDDWHRAVDRMRDGHDFHRVALVEMPLALPASAGPPGTAIIERFAPEAVTVRADASAPALLVLAEAWYPGWTATVDGAAAPCLPANAWMRGVPVPAGAHEVTFTFHSTRLRAGATLSIVTLALVLAALGRESRLRRRRRVR